MTEHIKYERNSEISRTIWGASWAVEKVAKEITDITGKDMTQQDMDDVAYLTGLLKRRAEILYGLVPTQSL